MPLFLQPAATEFAGLCRLLGRSHAPAAAVHNFGLAALSSVLLVGVVHELVKHVAVHAPQGVLRTAWIMFCDPAPHTARTAGTRATDPLTPRPDARRRAVLFLLSQLFDEVFGA